VRGWLTDALHFSTVTAAEVEAGIAELRRTGADRRADNLREWFDNVVEIYAARILPLDIAAARIARMVGDSALAAGRHPGFAAIAMAAIARSRGLAVATLNRRHFEPCGVEVVNPFAPD
jgi:toxin FitB